MFEPRGLLLGATSMKNLGLALALVLSTAAGCSSYASVSATADGHAIVAKNGLLGKSVYVCTVTPTGLTGCKDLESP